MVTTISYNLKKINDRIVAVLADGHDYRVDSLEEVQGVCGRRLGLECMFHVKYAMFGDLIFNIRGTLLILPDRVSAVRLFPIN
jgi:hypothetical protein